MAAISHLFLYYHNLPFTLHLDKVHRVSLTVLARKLISAIFHFMMALGGPDLVFVCVNIG